MAHGPGARGRFFPSAFFGAGRWLTRALPADEEDDKGKEEEEEDAEAGGDDEEEKGDDKKPKKDVKIKFEVRYARALRCGSWCSRSRTAPQVERGGAVVVRHHD